MDLTQVKGETTIFQTIPQKIEMKIKNHTYHKRTISSNSSRQRQTIRQVHIKIDDPSRGRHTASLTLRPNPLLIVGKTIVEPREQNPFANIVHITRKRIALYVRKRGIRRSAIRHGRILERLGRDPIDHTNLEQLQQTVEPSLARHHPEKLQGNSRGHLDTHGTFRHEAVLLLGIVLFGQLLVPTAELVYVEQVIGSYVSHAAVLYFEKLEQDLVLPVELKGALLEFDGYGRTHWYGR